MVSDLLAKLVRRDSFKLPNIMQDIPKRVIDNLDAVVSPGGVKLYWPTSHMRIPVDGVQSAKPGEKVCYFWEPRKGTCLETASYKERSYSKQIEMPLLYVVGSLEDGVFDWSEMPILSFAKNLLPSEDDEHSPNVFLFVPTHAGLLDFHLANLKFGEPDFYIGSAITPSEARVNWFENSLEFDPEKRLVYMRSPNKSVNFHTLKKIILPENGKNRTYSLVYENMRDLLNLTSPMQQSHAINFRGHVRWWLNDELLLDLLRIERKEKASSGF